VIIINTIAGGSGSALITVPTLVLNPGGSFYFPQCVVTTSGVNWGAFTQVTLELVPGTNYGQLRTAASNVGYSTIAVGDILAGDVISYVANYRAPG
jgi:hypothetical protein